MKIIGSLPHSVLKITGFKMDNRLSLKFETGLYEQTYKFRESDAVSNWADLERLVDAEFLRRVLENFERMHGAKNEATRKLIKSEEGGFEEII